ncbi:MAG: hypothetical protein H7Y20_14435 [Bryobacteraceae bacterium]|nr:hypothetical protein [Bryobacteraceae bacterium]
MSQTIVADNNRFTHPDRTSAKDTGKFLFLNNVLVYGTQRSAHAASSQ